MYIFDIRENNTLLPSMVFTNKFPMKKPGYARDAISHVLIIDEDLVMKSAADNVADPYL